MNAYDDRRVAWGKDLTPRQLFVGEAVGAALRSVGGDAFSIEFRNGEGEIKGVRPATPLEARMWLMLTSPTGDEGWSSVFFENPNGTNMFCDKCKELIDSVLNHPSAGDDVS